MSSSDNPTILEGVNPLEAGPQPNERYGDYEVIKPLASGGMADIFLARKLGAQGFQKLVVVKRIRREMVKDNHIIDMFIDEAHIAAKLDHPNVVVVSDLGELDDSYFMAMEYLRGQTLRSLEKRVQQYGQLLLPQIWARVMEYALDGLHYAHELTNDDGTLMGLVHRDFTPSNIMITYSGTVKVIDFGVARVAEGPSRHETKIGTLKGKIAYMSPEQCRGTTAVDRRTDVFAAGIVLWELLSGRQLFDGPSDTAILVEIIQGNIPTPTWGGKPVDKELNDIIMRALEREPENRYQTAAEMRDALRDYLRGQTQRVDATDISAVMSQFFEQERLADDRLVGKGDGTGMAKNPGTRRGDSVSRSGASRPGTSRPGSQPGSKPGAHNRSVSEAHGQQATNPGENKGGSKRLLPLILIGVVLGTGIAVGAWQFAKSKGGGGGTGPIAVVTPKPETPKPETPKPETPKPEATGEKPTGEKPTGETPTGEKPTGEKPTGEKPTEVAAKGETPPKGETAPKGETPKGETPPPKGETPKGTTPNPNEKGGKLAHKDPKGSTPESAPTGGSGSLDFDTRPYTQVFIGKKRLGDTPLLGVKVPAGKVTLTLVNEEAGIREQYTIEVPKDGHVSKKLKF